VETVGDTTLGQRAAVVAMFGKKESFEVKPGRREMWKYRLGGKTGKVDGLC